MERDRKLQLRELVIVSIVSFVLAFTLLLLVPVMVRVVNPNDHSGFAAFAVEVYVYAAPLAFALLGVSLLLVRNAILEDRVSLDWHIRAMKKEKGEKKGGTRN